MKAVVAGTFDPITLGHTDVIERASRLFDEVIVGVAESKGKNGKGTLFNLEERVKLAQKEISCLNNASAVPFTGLLVDFAREQKAQAIVRGLRVTADFEHEYQLAMVNHYLDSDLEMVFIVSSPTLIHVSSSVAKEVALFGGDLSTMVSPAVEEALKNKVRL